MTETNDRLTEGELREMRRDLETDDWSDAAIADVARSFIPRALREIEELRGIEATANSHFQWITEAEEELQQLRAQVEELRNAIRNQRGDDLCWIQNPENAEVAKVLGHRAEAGTPSGESCKTVSRYQVEWLSTRLKRTAQLESLLAEAAIEKRIAEAVATERERCAQIADLKAMNTGHGVCDEIAAAIRARGI